MRKILAMLSVAVFAMLSLTTINAFATSTSANLDQCANGGIGSTPQPCNNLGINSSWQNGNLNGNQAHYAEGQFIPYRIIITGISPGPHNIQIKYAVTKGTKHAIDYLGTFSTTEKVSMGDNPCGDKIPGCNPAKPDSITPVLAAALNGFPVGSGLNTFNGGQIAGSFAIWGGTLAPMSYIFQNVIDKGDYKTEIQLNFTATNSTVLIAWGGHVASANDWGVGNSSSAITGSPYHMALVTLDGASVGSQDRSLSTSAVLPTVSVFKFVNNDNTALTKQPSDFIMNVSSSISPSFPGDSNGTTVDVNPGSYIVTEIQLPGYIATFSSGCSGSLSAGQTAICNVNNNATTSPNISLTKLANRTNYSNVGDVIQYTYNITNTGNTNLNGPFNIIDNQINGGIPFQCISGGLSIGASGTCTANYTVTQADLDRGYVTNVATATGNGLTSNQATTTVTAIQNPAILLTKVANRTNYSNVGDVIQYTYTIKNNGNVDLNGPFNITDNQINGGTPFQCDGSGQLAPGASISCTATYTITQADLDRGYVTNVATATGGGQTSNQATTTVTAIQNPAISLTKVANVTTYDAVGNDIMYTYNITNVGNVVLNGPFNIMDNITGIVSPCGSGPLSPGASTQCTTNYTITQLDMDNGSVTNNATANTTYNGQTITSNPASTTVTAIQVRHLKVVKSGSLDISNSTIIYDINATNDGTVTLHVQSISDTNMILNCGTLGDLSPGASVSCTGTTSSFSPPNVNIVTTIQLANPNITITY